MKTEELGVLVFGALYLLCVIAVGVALGNGWMIGLGLTALGFSYITQSLICLNRDPGAPESFWLWTFAAYVVTVLTAIAAGLAFFA